MTVYKEAIRSPELRQQYKTGWFIVLTVTTGEKRVLSLAQKTLDAGGKRAFWFTTMERLEEEGVFGSVWIRATDVLESESDLRRRSVLEVVGR